MHFRKPSAYPTGRALQSLSALCLISFLLSLVVSTAADCQPQPPNLFTVWGSAGTGNSQFGASGPAGVAVDRSGLAVYVADPDNHRVQKFDMLGSFVAKWGSQGSGAGQFDRSRDVAVDGAGNVYVTDALNYRVQKFTSSGVFLDEWGSEGLFSGPSDIGVDETGYAYVSDSNNCRVQAFASSGAFHLTWGSCGSLPVEFDGPEGIGVLPMFNSDMVYVSDSDNHRVQGFGLALVPVEATTWGRVKVMFR